MKQTAKRECTLKRGNGEIQFSKAVLSFLLLCNFSFNPLGAADPPPPIEPLQNPNPSVPTISFTLLSQEPPPQTTSSGTAGSLTTAALVPSAAIQAPAPNTSIESVRLLTPLLIYAGQRVGIEAVVNGAGPVRLRAQRIINEAEEQLENQSNIIAEGISPGGRATLNLEGGINQPGTYALFFSTISNAIRLPENIQVRSVPAIVPTVTFIPAQEDPGTRTGSTPAGNSGGNGAVLTATIVSIPTATAPAPNTAIEFIRISPPDVDPSSPEYDTRVGKIDVAVEVNGNGPSNVSASIVAANESWEPSGEVQTPPSQTTNGGRETKFFLIDINQPGNYLLSVSTNSAGERRLIRVLPAVAAAPAPNPGNQEPGTGTNSGSDLPGGNPQDNNLNRSGDIQNPTGNSFGSAARDQTGLNLSPPRFENAPPFKPRPHSPSWWEKFSILFHLVRGYGEVTGIRMLFEDEIRQPELFKEEAISDEESQPQDKNAEKLTKPGSKKKKSISDYLEERKRKKLKRKKFKGLMQSQVFVDIPENQIPPLPVSVVGFNMSPKQLNEKTPHSSDNPAAGAGPLPATGSEKISPAKA